MGRRKLDINKRKNRTTKKVKYLIYEDEFYSKHLTKEEQVY